VRVTNAWPPRPRPPPSASTSTPAGWNSELWMIRALWTIAPGNDNAVARSRFDRAMTDDQRIWLEVSYAEQDAGKAACPR
jgi:hypothetical protein